jgi:hypothetical protein
MKNKYIKTLLTSVFCFLLMTNMSLAADSYIAYKVEDIILDIKKIKKIITEIKGGAYNKKVMDITVDVLELAVDRVLTGDIMLAVANPSCKIDKQIRNITYGRDVIEGIGYCALTRRDVDLKECQGMVAMPVSIDKNISIPRIRINGIEFVYKEDDIGAMLEECLYVPGWKKKLLIKFFEGTPNRNDVTYFVDKGADCKNHGGCDTNPPEEAPWPLVLSKKETNDINEQVIKKVLDFRRQGNSIKNISAKLNISENTVWRILELQEAFK